MQRDLRQHPAGWWDGGADAAAEGSSELARVCAHVAGHCQRAQHPDTLLFPKRPLHVCYPVRLEPCPWFPALPWLLVQPPCCLSPPGTSLPGRAAHAGSVPMPWGDQPRGIKHWDGKWEVILHEQAPTAAGVGRLGALQERPAGMGLLCAAGG